MDDDDDRSQFLRRNNYSPNARIMVTAIISLSFVIVIITVLHIYARCVLRRQARRRDAFRRLGFIPTTGVVQLSELPKTGLDATAIASLPKFLFKLSNLTEPETSSMECAVCLSFLEDGDVVRSLPNCRHTFHADGIDQWLGSNSTCPICRTEAEPRLVPEPREVPIGVSPSAPPLEGTSDAKVGSSSTRLTSFRRMISRERSSRRIHVESCGGQEDRMVHDIESNCVNSYFKV